MACLPQQKIQTRRPATSRGVTILPIMKARKTKRSCQERHRSTNLFSGCRPHGMAAKASLGIQARFVRQSCRTSSLALERPQIGAPRSVWRYKPYHIVTKLALGCYPRSQTLQVLHYIRSASRALGQNKACREIGKRPWPITFHFVPALAHVPSAFGSAF